MLTLRKKLLLRTLLLSSAVSLGLGAATPQAPTAAFDPEAGTLPLPNILATAAAPDPLIGLSAGQPLNPLQSLAYINTHEVGGSNAVAGVNAPIWLFFSQPVAPASATGATVKVFLIQPERDGTEDRPLRFQDVTGRFTFQFPAGGQNLLLFPNVPLPPGTRYLYLVTPGVRGVDGSAVMASSAFTQLKSTTPLADPVLEAIRANVVRDRRIILSGYAKVMDDLIASAATTGIASRADIILMGRFITSTAGFIAPDLARPARIPVDAALRAFAQGASMPGGLSGLTWDNSIQASAPLTGSNLLGYWRACWTGASAIPPVPSGLGQIVLGTIHSALLGMDPVVAAQSSDMDLSTEPGAVNDATGVVQPFRSAGRLTGFYHVPQAIPFVYLAPAAPAPRGGYPLVIYQHGIDSSKESVVALAQSLTGHGYAVLAIDLPLHGALALSDHQNQPQFWGQDFMAIGTPLVTRSNLQQAAFNLHRLELTVAAGGFARLGAKAPARTGMHFVGISLGSIVGTYYLAGNATLESGECPYRQASLDRDMKGLLSVPGSRLTYLIQASPAFGPTVAGDLLAFGLSAGSPAYSAFFQLTQTVVDTVDPATMTTPLAPGLPSRLSGRIAIQEATSTTFDAEGNPTNGDLVITNPFARYLGNALGGEAVLGTEAAAAIAPGFFQLGYGLEDRIPSTFMFTLEHGAVRPKTEPAALTPRAVRPTEGYFQFDQAGIEHGALLDILGQPDNAKLFQDQMLFFLGLDGGRSIVVDPTQSALALP